MFRAVTILVLFCHINAEPTKNWSVFHNIRNCFVAINAEPLGYEDDRWDIAHDSLILKGVLYNRFKVSLKGKLWCITYFRHGDFDRVNVYTSEESCEECLSALEKEMPGIDTAYSIYFNNSD